MYRKILEGANRVRASVLTATAVGHLSPLSPKTMTRSRS